MRKDRGRLLTGHAKLKGKTILDFSLCVPLVENLFPPRTGVVPVPKLQAPAAETRDWYSFRQTLKYVSHSSRVHLRSAGFLAPPQHEPFCSSPFAFCIDTISSSKCPDASDTCWAEQTLNPRSLYNVQWDQISLVLFNSKNCLQSVCQSINDKLKNTEL